MPSDTLSIDHSLPDHLREKVGENTVILAEFYNQLNDMPENTFTSKFEHTLHDIHQYSNENPTADLLFFLIGASIANEQTLEEGDLIGDATTSFVFELGDDDFIDDYHYMTDSLDDQDYFFLLTIRPEDCPPGSNTPATELDISLYQDLVSAAVFKRLELLQNNPSQYKRTCLQPVITALEDYHQQQQ